MNHPDRLNSISGKAWRHMKCLLKSSDKRGLQSEKRSTQTLKKVALWAIYYNRYNGVEKSERSLFWRKNKHFYVKVWDSTMQHRVENIRLFARQQNYSNFSWCVLWSNLKNSECIVVHASEAWESFWRCVPALHFNRLTENPCYDMDYSV